MFRRLLNPSKNNSLMMFGPRGTGKTTFLRELLKGRNTLWIDLLKEADEERYGRHPDELSRVLDAQNVEWVVIDEIQKAPKLLDIVHLEIEKKSQVKFAVTGSSARKLKRGDANLLGGRAFAYRLFPLSFVELGERFQLSEALELGTLPKIYELSDEQDRQDFLRTYVRTFLKEEILMEQVLRKVEPFRNFLPVAAQQNGEIINYSHIARDVGADDKTVRSYFQILEDTLLGFLLPAHHRSVRKQQRLAPKFYFFDPGVTRALAQTLRVKLVPGTSAFGRAFEHFVILEVMRLNEYERGDLRLSYLRTKDDAEIDLVVEMPGGRTLLVEIKSSDLIREDHVARLARFQRDWPVRAEAQVWSRDPVEKMIGEVRSLHWRTGIERLFGL